MNTIEILAVIFIIAFPLLNSFSLAKSRQYADSNKKHSYWYTACSYLIHVVPQHFVTHGRLGKFLTGRDGLREIVYKLTAGVTQSLCFIALGCCAFMCEFRKEHEWKTRPSMGNLN